MHVGIEGKFTFTERMSYSYEMLELTEFCLNI